MLIQQGDVLIQSVEKFPKDAKKIEPEARGFVLAEGEATGHYHALSGVSGVEMLEERGVRFIRNSKEVAVNHQEHSTVKIPAGKWKINIVQEYDHFEEEARKVRD